LATDNILKIIQEDGTDILCIQEPYALGNTIVGLPQYCNIFASEGRKRAAIFINNRQIYTLLINQLSDEYVVVLETKVGNTRIIIASSYYINLPLDTDMQKIEATIAHAKGAGVIIAMDSNSKSTSWHDIKTNRRAKILEEFLMSKQLHIINESCYTTFGAVEVPATSTKQSPITKHSTLSRIE